MTKKECNEIISQFNQTTSTRATGYISYGEGPKDYAFTAKVLLRDLNFVVCSPEAWKAKNSGATAQAAKPNLSLEQKDYRKKEGERKKEEKNDNPFK